MEVTKRRLAAGETRSRARRAEELYAHIHWHTFEDAPLLADAEVTEAVHRAIQSRARMYRCRVLAVGGLATHRHVIVKFTASVPLAVIANALMNSAEVAVLQTYQMLRGEHLPADRVWDEEYGIQTLAPANLTEALDYIDHQSLYHAAEETRRTWEAVDTPREKHSRTPQTQHSSENHRTLVYH